MDPISIALGLAQFIPSVIRWLTGSGQAGEIASKVVETAKAIAGHDDPQAATAAIKADPALQARLREAWMQHELALYQAETDRLRLPFEDLATARAREMHVRDRVPAVMGFVLLLGFFALLSFLLVRDVPAGSRDVLNIMLGSLGSGFVAVVSYYFGSSADSAVKTLALARAADPAAPASPAAPRGA